MTRGIRERNGHRSEPTVVSVVTREKEVIPRGILSFLALNSYPDTGESGDAYDVEAILEN